MKVFASASAIAFLLTSAATAHEIHEILALSSVAEAVSVFHESQHDGNEGPACAAIATEYFRCLGDEFNGCFIELIKNLAEDHTCEMLKDSDFCPKLAECGQNVAEGTDCTAQGEAMKTCATSAYSDREDCDLCTVGEEEVEIKAIPPSSASAPDDESPVTIDTNVSDGAEAVYPIILADVADISSDISDELAFNLPDYCSEEHDYDCFMSGVPRCCIVKSRLRCPSNNRPQCDVFERKDPTQRLPATSWNDDDGAGWNNGANNRADWNNGAGWNNGARNGDWNNGAANNGAGWNDGANNGAGWNNGANNRNGAGWNNGAANNGAGWNNDSNRNGDWNNGANRNGGWNNGANRNGGWNNGADRNGGWDNGRAGGSCTVNCNCHNNDCGSCRTNCNCFGVCNLPMCTENCQCNAGLCSDAELGRE